MELYIVRHGQSQGNVGAADRDPPLTPLGEAQASLLGERFSDEPFDFVFSSHLRRAVQTAAAVLARQENAPALRIVPELAECGDRDHRADPDLLRALYADCEVAGVVSRPFADDAQRALFCLETCVFPFAYGRDLPGVGRCEEGEIAKKDTRVLLVCHGTFNAHLIGRLAHFPFDKNMVVCQYNACVTHFQLYRVDGVRRVRFVSFNDVSHLPPAMRT